MVAYHEIDLSIRAGLAEGPQDLLANEHKALFKLKGARVLAVFSELRAVGDIARERDHVWLNLAGLVDEDPEDEHVEFDIVKVRANHHRLKAAALSLKVVVEFIVIWQHLLIVEIAEEIHGRVFRDLLFNLVSAAGELQLRLAALFVEGSEMLVPGGI